MIVGNNKKYTSSILSTKSTTYVSIKIINTKKDKLKPAIKPLIPSIKLYKLIAPTNNISKNEMAIQSTIYNPVNEMPKSIFNCHISITIAIS